MESGGGAQRRGVPAMKHAFTFQDTLHRFPGGGGVFYLTVGKAIATSLRELYRPNHGGWASLRVEVRVGKTTWRTSIFWNKNVSYWLFVKAAVRKQEKLTHGKKVRAYVRLLNV